MNAQILATARSMTGNREITIDVSELERYELYSRKVKSKTLQALHKDFPKFYMPYANRKEDGCEYTNIDGVLDWYAHKKLHELWYIKSITTIYSDTIVKMRFVIDGVDPASRGDCVDYTKYEYNFHTQIVHVERKVYKVSENEEHIDYVMRFSDLL